MLDVAKRGSRAAPAAVLPNLPEWRARVRAELAKGGRGAHAKLARAIGCSTGALAEVIAELDDQRPNAARYSRWVIKINDYFGWTAMMPATKDANEIRYLLEKLADADIELLRLIKNMDRDEQRALVDFYTKIRSKTS